MRKINTQFPGIYATIGNNIMRLRGGMSQEELAKKARVSRSTIQAIEAGKPISLENLLKIASVLNIEPSDLFISDITRSEITYKHKILLDLILKSLGIENK